MRRGQRLQLVMTEPFSIEIRSAGKPSLIILAVLPSVVNMFKGSTLSVIGIERDTKSGIQVSFQRASRFSWSNAPT